MHEDDDTAQIEHPDGELGCIVVAIYAGAAAAGLLILRGRSSILARQRRIRRTV